MILFQHLISRKIVKLIQMTYSSLIDKYFMKSEYLAMKEMSCVLSVISLFTAKKTKTLSASFLRPNFPISCKDYCTHTHTHTQRVL